MFDVSIILVSYNVRALVDECLRSIKRETSRSYEIIVVDNASSDGSAAMIRETHPDVRIIENGDNIGFARANNQGFRIARGKYVFMLNPDTVVLDGAIDRLLLFMDGHPEAGACGPRNIGPDHSLQSNCHHFPSLALTLFDHLQLTRFFPGSRVFGRENMTYWSYDRVRAVDWITGCSLLVRKDALDRCGLLDENYFLYMEECDLSFRMRRLGFRTFFFPDASIIHFGGQSSRAQSGLGVHSGSITKHLYETRYYFFRKNFGRMREAVLRGLDIAYFGVRLLKNIAFGRGGGREMRLSEDRTFQKAALGCSRVARAKSPS
jgi:hypothetical protein